MRFPNSWLLSFWLQKCQQEITLGVRCETFTFREGYSEGEETELISKLPWPDHFETSEHRPPFGVQTNFHSEHFLSILFVKVWSNTIFANRVWFVLVPSYLYPAYIFPVPPWKMNFSIAPEIQADWKRVSLLNCRFISLIFREYRLNARYWCVLKNTTRSSSSLLFSSQSICWISTRYYLIRPSLGTLLKECWSAWRFLSCLQGGVCSSNARFAYYNQKIGICLRQRSGGLQSKPCIKLFVSRRNENATFCYNVAHIGVLDPFEQFQSLQRLIYDAPVDGMAASRKNIKNEVIS